MDRELSTGRIALRGVEVHNLKKVDLDIPHHQLVVICGVSGSGKTSLALDTLYAEGQRRYIESFSAYTRQFLERLDKPAAERIDGIPPSIAVTHKNSARSSRTTVGTATETHEYLRLLFARIGQVFCHGCGRPVHRDTPESAAELLGQLGSGTRYMVTFSPPVGADESWESVVSSLVADGFVRALIGDTTVTLSELGERIRVAFVRRTIAASGRCRSPDGWRCRELVCATRWKPHFAMAMDAVSRTSRPTHPPHTRPSCRLAWRKCRVSRSMDARFCVSPSAQR